ncbi:hypothetical protein [Nocardia carnea]|uniref:hypothetical protein n=1 Tax=Nocardia carnea TaxID=37328 RepID=UPI0024566B64|nr:hypothetical protein [Nocardia carnea]
MSTTLTVITELGRALRASHNLDVIARISNAVMNVSDTGRTLGETTESIFSAYRAGMADIQDPQVETDELAAVAAATRAFVAFESDPEFRHAAAQTGANVRLSLSYAVVYAAEFAREAGASDEEVIAASRVREVQPAH